MFGWSVDKLENIVRVCGENGKWNCNLRISFVWGGKWVVEIEER